MNRLDIKIILFDLKGLNEEERKLDENDLYNVRKNEG